MSKKSARFIDGIYNYCDRWCERCPFTDRCRSFDMEQKLRRRMEREERREKERTADPKPTPTPWEEYEKSAEAIEPWLDAERRQWELQEAKKEREIRKAPLTRRGKKYSETAMKWLEANDPRFLEPDLADTLTVKSQAAAAADPVFVDAISVISWYLHFIQIKLMRRQRVDSAADRFGEADPEDAEDAEIREAVEEAQRDDNNGSAKVALIGIDRSLAAWAVLRDRGHPEVEDFLRQLDQLRSVAEMVFPNARDFIRPGLDWPAELLDGGSC